MSMLEPVGRASSGAITRPAPPERGYPTNGADLRYRLNVVAPSPLDAVQSVGGWLFDHAMAGWEVTVLLIDEEDPRPLRILGADVLGPVAWRDSWTRRAPAQLLALAGDLLDRDDVYETVGQSLSPALRRDLTQVAVWGDHTPPEWDRSLYEVRHELSAAARVFKAHALAAAGESEPPSRRVEIFGYGRLVRQSVGRADEQAPF